MEGIPLPLNSPPLYPPPAGGLSRVVFAKPQHLVGRHEGLNYRGGPRRRPGGPVGPPHVILLVRAVRYISLAASLMLIAIRKASCAVEKPKWSNTAMTMRLLSTPHISKLVMLKEGMRLPVRSHGRQPAPLSADFGRSC
jgi:hypothetical protein